MSDREASSEGEGDDIRPFGEGDPDRDSSDESDEDDPEEARRIAEGFIVDEDDEDDSEDDEEERRRKRKERRKKRKRRERERRQREEEEISEDDLELLNENLGGGRPLKRLRHRGSESDDNIPRLQDMFDDEDERRRSDDESDMGDFIEEDEEEEQNRNETEEERRARRREEKRIRREQARARPELAGVNQESWDEIYDVFGDGHDYDWALEGEEGVEEDEDEPKKKDLRLEDVFDPAEIKARRLQDEDRAIAHMDRPERHQVINSTLSDNPIIAPDSIFPPPDLAARWAHDKISPRTRYIFCGLDAQWPMPSPEDPYPQPAKRRPDLLDDYQKAVSEALNMMFVQHLEVPYLWHYKRDSFGVLEAQGQSSVQFLDGDELWELYNLGQKYRAIWERVQSLKEQWRKIKERKPDLEDEYLEKTLLSTVCLRNIETAAEGADWLAYTYASELRAIKEEAAAEEGTKRLPERQSGGKIRDGPVLKLAEAFGISVPTVALVFNETDGDPASLSNPEKMPLALAEEFSGEGTPFYTPEDALKAAKEILINDFAHDPTIRQQARDFVEALGTVTVTPTERGMASIDAYHAYYPFKFLTDKPIPNFKDSAQFLHLLKAEEEGLITISISAPEESTKEFISALSRCAQSKDYSELAVSWNAERGQVIDTAFRKHYLPAACRWIKEQLRTDAETWVCDQARLTLEDRCNVRPFASNRMRPGEVPNVLAITIGQGTKKDAVIGVLLGDDGNIRASYKFDNLRDADPRRTFMDVVERQRPDVIAIAGLSVETARLRNDAQSALREIAIEQSGLQPPQPEDYSSHDDYQMELSRFNDSLGNRMTPLIMVNDETARLYMNSTEAAQEHPELPVNGRYALALARYTQNPLNAYARVGKQLTALTFVDLHQKLVPEEKLLLALERGLVNAVAICGLELNITANSPYQRYMLPYIAGLGPRKANQLANAISQSGGHVMNRMALPETNTLGPTVFENVAGFLYISADLKDFSQLEAGDTTDQPEPLDMTRIHPEDYEFAQKMCQDALDLDAEDVADQHKSAVVVTLMNDEDRGKKLRDLNIDDFAFNLQRQGEGNKRHALGEIVSELVHWHADRRPPFYIPDDWQILTMLTGESSRTINRGLQVTATVRKALSSRVFCTLESGIEAVLEREYVSDNDDVNSCDDVFKPRQAIKAVIIDVDPVRFEVRLSTRASDMSQSVPFIAPFRQDEFNDEGRMAMAEEAAAAKRRRQAGSVKRVVNHPNWHVMNSGQAEQFLAPLQRGDVVVRPSSKGADHLAVTWKVDEDVYQHIDVQEIDKPNEYALGRILRIANKYSYSDLDDLIINHVKAIVRKFDEVQMHEKFKNEGELESFLKNYVQAHPGRSTYGFCIDSDHPGYLKLSFLNKSTKDGGQIQTWHVKVLPGAYQLNNAEVPGVTELCNAFKAQYSARLDEQGLGGRTPGVRMAARTPMHGGRTPGGRTPGMPMRGAATPMYGGRTPMHGGGGRMPPPPQGYPPQGGYPPPGYGGDYGRGGGGMMGRNGGY